MTTGAAHSRLQQDSVVTDAEAAQALPGVGWHVLAAAYAQAAGWRPPDPLPTACRPDRLLSGRRVLPAQVRAAYLQLARRVVAGEPLAYVLGSQAFLDDEFCVDRRVLIPRPETEQLVLLAADCIRRWGCRRVVDVGTGSGCIAISLALRCPDAAVSACDLCPDALAVARLNARRLGARVTCWQGDCLSALPAEQGLPEMIVANLPYISLDDPDLDESVRAFEPGRAIWAGADGLALYGRLLRQIRRRVGRAALTGSQTDRQQKQAARVALLADVSRALSGMPGYNVQPATSQTEDEHGRPVNRIVPVPTAARHSPTAVTETVLPAGSVCLLAEIGWRQGSAAVHLARAQLPGCASCVLPDAAGRDRFFVVVF